MEKIANLIRGELARINATEVRIMFHDLNSLQFILPYRELPRLTNSGAQKILKSLPNNAGVKALEKAIIKSKRNNFDLALLPTLKVGLSGWIIEDGNYPDLEKSCYYNFALEYNFVDYEKVSFGEEHLDWKEDCDYEGIGRVIYHQRHATVLDFGDILAYEDHFEADFEVGELVGGIFSLGIDTYFYKDYLYLREGFPALMYSWNVENIQVQKAPYLVVSPPNTRPVVMERDRTRWGWKDVNKTSVLEPSGEEDEEWGDDEYLLTLRKMSYAYRPR